jgi:predicted ATP-grasp superfamily ATP-dependent carboligase
MSVEAGSNQTFQLFEHRSRSDTILATTSMANNERAIVLGVEHPRAIAVLQSLGRAGVPLIAIDHTRSPIGFHSRYLSKSFAVPNSGEAALSLLEQLGKEGGGVLIPTTDDYLILVSQHFESLSRQFTLTTPAWNQLEPLMDLPALYSRAHKIGIKVPLFFKPQDEKELLSFVQKLDFKNHSYLLKTRPGSVAADARSGRFTKVAGSSPEEAVVNANEIYSRLGEYPVIARVVPGEADRCIGVCMVVNRDHESVVCFCVRRLRLFTYSRGGQYVHPYVLGANVFCESVHDEEAMEVAKQLVRVMKYFGPIAVEFRRDSTDNSLTLIKADPRPVRATSLSAALDMDIPLSVYHAFTSKKVVVSSQYKDGVSWVWVSIYFASLWENRRNRPIIKELFSLLTRFWKIKAVANFSLRDPFPFLVEQKRWWIKFSKHILKRSLAKLAKVPNKTLYQTERQL